MSEPLRPKVWQFPRVLTEHLFDKLWRLDLSLGEFRALLDERSEIVETTEISGGQIKELVLYLGWTRPLHVVVVVDLSHGEERLVTVYEPAADRWDDEFRKRR